MRKGEKSERAFETLSRHEVPREFQEEHVVMGFRPVNRPLTYYLCTLFTMHNEVVNVWTHLIPFGLMLRLFITILREDSEAAKYQENLESPETESNDPTTPALKDNRRSFYLFMCTALGYLLVSAAAHLMHSASKTLHYLAFYCDFATIAFYSFLSAVAFYIYSSTDEFHFGYQYLFIPVAFILALSVSYACCYAKFKFTRPYPPEKKLYICGTVGSLYLWNIYPIVNRMINDDIQGNTYHYIHICTFLAAVFFYSSGWPQKSYPGFCDHFFHGHQIFHVLIAITTYYQVLSLRYDMSNYFLKSSENSKLKYGNVRHDCWSEISPFFALHVIFTFLVIMHFYKRIQLVLSHRKVQ